MILGLNTDVKYKGKTFHIQTEDSGRQNPVLITHVFIGGTIIATRRSTYEEALERPDLEDLVRSRMRAQHRETYEALLAGEYDELVRRPPRPERDIPLARAKVQAVSVGPAPDPVLVDATVSEPPLSEDGPADDDIEPLDSVDLVPLDLEPAADAPPAVEFPTPLVSGRPLDPYLVATLLEED